MLIFNLKVKILIKKQNWTKPEKKKIQVTRFFFLKTNGKSLRKWKKKHLKMKPIKNDLKKGKKPSKFE